MFLSIIFRQWKRACSCFFRNDGEDREGHLHGLNSTTTSFAEQTELLVPFPTFRAATMEERQMELFIPFWTFHAAQIEEERTKLFVLFRISHTSEVFIERNSSLQRWIEANEYSLKSS